MAAATVFAMYQQNGAASLAAAFPQVGGPAQNSDLIQIVGLGGKILLNVDYAGVVHNPAVAATGLNVRIGQFQTTLSSTATTAQLFANAFTNPQQQDILQVKNIGGNISYWLDYLGVAHGA